MLMRNLETNARYRRHGASGFSLIEMVSVVAISIVVTVVSVVSLGSVLNQQHVANAYNTTLAAMRQARDNAVSQRASYVVTFSNTVSPNTIAVAPTGATFTGDQNTVTYQLPTDVTFLAQSGLATTPPPDGFGTGVNAIDFGYTATVSSPTGSTQNTIYFCPDGSAQTAACNAGGYAINWDGGVVYLARSGDVLSSRAVTLYGGTGRIHGWRLYLKTGGGYQWVRQ
jgi:Tfp pilus assembly protein FimT